ncbi:MAG TPA: hypothetical protein VG755_30630 [Nannocystaceae bacterium]|nr:hypothetical protein [Nannocystaceae bacterium]
MRTPWLEPVLILAWSTVAFAVLWSSARYDDFAGWAVVVALTHLLLWIGLRGAAPRRGQRIAIAIAGAVPTAAWVVALTPWVVRPGGLESLGTAVMMVIFGIPLGVIAAALTLYRITRASSRSALGRTLALVAATTAVAWVLALAWTRDGGEKALELLVFPGLATWWLLLPAVGLAARRMPMRSSHEHA